MFSLFRENVSKKACQKRFVAPEASNWRAVRNGPINLVGQCSLFTPGRCLNHSALVTVAWMGNWMRLRSSDLMFRRSVQLISGYKSEAFCLNYSGSITATFSYSFNQRHVSLCTCAAPDFMHCSCSRVRRSHEPRRLDNFALSNVLKCKPRFPPCFCLI